MILDNIENYATYLNLGPRFKVAFDFILKTDLKNLSLGKHAIDGDDVFVILMEYETKETVDCIMENHKKYVDIQYMLRGEELMGVKTLRGDVPTTPYDETKDAAFYAPKFDSSVKVKEGQFTIFFTQDLHMPSMKSGESAKVLKAVFKIKAN